MPPFTALLHTTNDALRLGRALETLLPCSEILIVDHHSIDATRRIAREYGARVVDADSQAPAHHYLNLASHDWILCMEPAESITEGLQASLFEWSALPSHTVVGSGNAFSVFVQEQTSERWLESLLPETRLIPRSWRLWHGSLPAHEPSAIALEGELLRFALPCEVTGYRGL
jgi:glycosyltransferase involved in cell wall biosynthesis